MATNIQQTPMAATTRMDERSIRKIALTALAGTSIEWYDFFLYGTAAALIFPKAFFAADMPPAVALLASFSTFAVGFGRRLPRARPRAAARRGDEGPARRPGGG
jgi:hypothetical protein